MEKRAGPKTIDVRWVGNSWQVVNVVSGVGGGLAADWWELYFFGGGGWLEGGAAM